MCNVLRLAVLVVGCGIPSLFAGNITFTYAGNGTGSLNGTPFTSDPFVLVFSGNITGTNNIPVTGTLALSGFGSATLTNTYREMYEPFGPPGVVGGIQDANEFVNGEPFTSGLLSAALSGPSDWNNWNPASPSSIGPEPFYPWSIPPSVWATTLGNFSLSSVSSTLFGSSEGVLTVTVAPEPSTPFLAGAGILGAIIMRKRHLGRTSV